MLDAKQVKHGGVQVVDGNDVVDRVVAQFVGLAMRDAGFDAAPGQPERKALDVMVAGLHGRAPRIHRPRSQGFVEKAAAFEVDQQAGGRGSTCWR